MRTDLIKQAVENRRIVEKTLAASKRGMILTQIAEAAKLPITTVKVHLDKLISIGSVHVDRYRGFNVYAWIGKEVCRDSIILPENRVLFIDAVVDPAGEPFVRIKEAEKAPGSDRWDDVGAILVDNRCVADLISKLRGISKKLSVPVH